MWHEQRKYNKLSIDGVKIDLSLALREPEPPAESYRKLKRVALTARVVDDSAYPVIRENDLVLLECIEPVTEDALNRLEDRIVAVVASSGSDSFGFLKRLGATIQPGMRLLEKVGLTGSSVPVMVGGSDESGSGGALALARLWRVHGIIRSEILPR